MITPSHKVRLLHSLLVLVPASLFLLTNPSIYDEPFFFFTLLVHGVMSPSDSPSYAFYAYCYLITFLYGIAAVLFFGSGEKYFPSAVIARVIVAFTSVWIFVHLSFGIFVLIPISAITTSLPFFVSSFIAIKLARKIENEFKQSKICFNCGYYLDGANLYRCPECGSAVNGNAVSGA